MDIDIIDRAPETKAGISGEAYARHDEVMRIFEEYKATNDARVAKHRERPRQPIRSSRRRWSRIECAHGRASS